MKRILNWMGFTALVAVPMVLIMILQGSPQAQASGVTVSPSTYINPVTYANRTGTGRVYEFKGTASGPCVLDVATPLPAGWTMPSDVDGNCTFYLPDTHAGNPTGYMVGSATTVTPNRICNPNLDTTGPGLWKIIVIVKCTDLTGASASATFWVRWEDWSAGH